MLHCNYSSITVPQWAYQLSKRTLKKIFLKFSVINNCFMNLAPHTERCCFSSRTATYLASNGFS